MKCPWCEKEMTAGFINSARKVLFSKNPNNDFFFIKSKDDVMLTQHNWTCHSAKAYHCPDCKKVIVDYDVAVE